MLKIGNILKRARVDKGMTLEDLSSRCGYSKALISRIENNSVSPSIASLTKISEMLDLKLYDIFASAKLEEPSILKKNKREKFSTVDGKYDVEFLTSGISTKMMQPFLISLESGNNSWEGTDSHNGEKFLLILEGRAEVLVGDQKHVLKPGDSIYLKSFIPHKCKGIGKGKTVSLAVTHPPYY